jgi:hypothetical protein
MMPAKHIGSSLRRDKKIALHEGVALIVHRQEIAFEIILYHKFLRGQFIEVVHIERLAGEEHHVVADIDDVVDASHAFGFEDSL